MAFFLLWMAIDKLLIPASLRELGFLNTAMFAAEYQPMQTSLKLHISADV